ncbi:MAG: DUF4339 domain-containing protein [Synergistaceae bacterium]|jgi:hypothetical protein|nr:DUF4339 domain-containing protein [Synergistaceae bacterium]
MAGWYYSKNGQTFGPFAREAMDGLIASGEVTFVTLLWSEETGRDGRGWVYAYETDLNEYFLSDLTPPLLPPVDQATAPEAPVILPELSPPAAPVYVPLTTRQERNGVFAKKTSPVLAVFLVMFVLGLLLGIVAAGYIFYRGTYAENSVPVTEQALPSVNGGDSIVLKVSDMEILRSLLFGVESAISSLGPGIANEGPVGENILPRVKSSIEDLRGLFEMMDEMSVLLAPSDGPAVYASFVGKGGALDIFMSRPQAFFSARTWNSDPDGKTTGWRISVSPLEDPVLYVLKRPYGERDIVYAARTEEGVEAMLSASRGETGRFIPERATFGRDFLQIKFPNGFTYGAIEKAFPPLSGTQRIQTARTGKVLWTMSETSWTKEGNVLEYDTYGDFLTRNPGLAANMPKITRETKFLGDGELTCFIAVDAGFMMECVFPGSADPIGETLETFYGRRSKIAAAGDRLEAVLENARLSAVCTEKNGHVQTAYLLLETDEEEPLDEFWRTYAPFAATLGGEPLNLDGWNSAISVRIPFYGGSGSNIVFAHRRGALLLGIGEPANFAKSVPIKSEYQDYISPENVANIIVSPKFYDTLLGLTDSYYVGAADSGGRQKMKNGLIAFRNSFQLFCGNVKPSGHSNGRLVLTEGGDPVGAIFKLLSQIAPVMSRQN